MKSIIVGKKLPFGDGLSIDGTLYKKDASGLTDGAISISRSDNDRIISPTRTNSNTPFTANDNFADDTMLQIIQGASDGVLLSPVFPRKGFSYVKTTYVTPVGQDIYIGRDAGGSPVATWNLPFTTDASNYIGQKAAIRVYDLSAPPGVTNNVYYFEYEVKKDDEGKEVRAGLLAELAKQVGTGKLFSAASDASDTNNTEEGIRVIGNIGNHLKVIPEGLLKGTTLTDAVSYVVSQGVADMLLELEKNYASRKGYNATYNTREELYNAGFNVDSNINYDVFVLTWDSPNKQLIAAGVDPMVQHCLVVLPTGTLYPKINTQFENALKAIIADADTTWTNSMAIPTHVVTIAGASIVGDEVVATSDDGEYVVLTATGNDTMTVGESTYINIISNPDTSREVVSVNVNEDSSSAFDVDGAPEQYKYGPVFEAVTITITFGAE